MQYVLTNNNYFYIVVIFFNYLLLYVYINIYLFMSYYNAYHVYNITVDNSSTIVLRKSVVNVGWQKKKNYPTVHKCE